MPTALVLGGYGLIGAACCRALTASGMRVIGLGRSRAAAMAAAPDQEWIIRDLATLALDDWPGLLRGVDIVVNAAGALQDGPGDDLEKIHTGLIDSLCKSAPPSLRIVQISAAGADLHASTHFFRSKARGDAILRAAPCDWVILRPTLVLSRDAYGGTALLRGASALPALLPNVLPDSPVQTVHIDDVAGAVVAAALGQVPSGTVVDLTETGKRPLPDLMRTLRVWLGLPPARISLPVPNGLLSFAGFMADGAGWLGWRAPLRTTALSALRDGITGDAAPWQNVGGAPCRSLDQTLASMPATRQERVFARLYFALPLAIVTLSLFWVVSGLIALAQPVASAHALKTSGLPAAGVLAIVIGGGLVDLALGLAILWRLWCRLAALGMIVVSLAYLAGGAFLAPHLWAEPLGPMVKVLPAIVLTAIVCLMVQER